VTDVRDGDDRIEVWYLIGTLAVGGTEKTLVDLVSGLDRERFAPTIWTLADPGPLAEEVPDDVPVRSLGASSKSDLRAPLRFVRALRRGRPDVLQSFLFFDNTVARLAGVFSPETTVVTGVRGVPDSRSVLRTVVDRATLPLSDRIVSNSADGTEWAESLGGKPSSITTIHTGRDVARYADVTASEDLRGTLGLGEEPVVGTVGRLVENKGGYDLLDAWVKVRSDHPEAQLLFVGDGPERTDLEAYAASKRVRESVVFAGQRDDVPRLLASMDIFAFPSHHEGLPGALLEAMCAGLPIVTTPVGGCSELIRDGEEGLYVPVRNPDRLAAAIGRLLENRRLARQLGENARKRASAFSIEAMVEDFELLYRQQ